MPACLLLKGPKCCVLEGSACYRGCTVVQFAQVRLVLGIPKWMKSHTINQRNFCGTNYNEWAFSIESVGCIGKFHCYAIVLQQ